MSFSFNASLSGLNANSNALGVVGNNIANANTVGFRSSNVTFMDVFASSYGARLKWRGKFNADRKRRTGRSRPHKFFAR